MRDDLTSDEDVTPVANGDDAGLSAADVLESKLAALQLMEDALAKSSARLSELLSLIDDPPGPVPATFESARAWVEPDPDAPEGLGRIMLSRPSAGVDDTPAALPPAQLFKTLPGLVETENPLLAANVAVASGHAANDNAVWLGGDAEGAGGFYGREPSVATLADGHTVIAWIGEDNIVHAQMHPAEVMDGARGAVAPADVTALNALLANLGQAAPALGKDGGRLTVAATGPGSFAAVWVAELGLAAVLAGQVFAFHAVELDGTHPDGGRIASGWSVKDLPAVPVTGVAAGGISIALTDTGSLAIGYESTSAEGHRSQHTVVTEALTPETGIARSGAASGELSGASPGLTETGAKTHGHDASAHHEMESGPDNSGTQGTGGGGPSGDGFSAESESLTDDTSIASGTSGALSGGLKIAGADFATIAQALPNVAVSSDGNIHVLELGPGATPETSTITIAMLDATGKPLAGADGATPGIEVTAHAIVDDTVRPEIDLTPKITAVGSGVGVAWVQSSEPEGSGAKELAVQVYGSDGKPVSDAPAIVSVSDGGPSSISDIDMTGLDSANAGASRNGAAADAAAETGGASDGASPDLAIVWVKDADDGGYGAVNLQLFAINDGPSGAASDQGGKTFVPLGQDFKAGGDDDRPSQVSRDDTPVVGRDPQVEGVKGGALAVAWVAPADALGDPPVVTGVVLDTQNGQQLAALDLSAFMPNGVADGTDPVLVADNNGDIVVGWVQMASAGGYNAEAAVYRFVSDGHWMPPASSLFLSHFTELPRNLSIIVTGSDDPSLIVTWQDHGDVTGACFDLNGNQIGDTFEIDNGNGRAGSHAAYAPDGGPQADANHGPPDAAMSDGQLVVVYAQHDASAADAGNPLYSNELTSAVAAPISEVLQDADLSRTQADAVATIVATVAGFISDATSASSAEASSGASSDANDVSQPSSNVAENGADAPAAGGTAGSADAASAAAVAAEDTSDAVPSPGSTSVVIDLARDVIELVAEETPAATLTTEAILTFDGPSASDVAAAIETYTGTASDPVLVRGPAANDGAAANTDSITFVQGFGNDAAPPLGDLEAAPAVVHDTLAAAFDALQFANALCVDANNDVIVFDTSNVVSIRSFAADGTPDGGIG